MLSQTIAGAVLDPLHLHLKAVHRVTMPRTISHRHSRRSTVLTRWRPVALVAVDRLSHSAMRLQRDNHTVQLQLNHHINSRTAPLTIKVEAAVQRPSDQQLQAMLGTEDLMISLHRRDTTPSADSVGPMADDVVDCCRITQIIDMYL